MFALSLSLSLPFLSPPEEKKRWSLLSFALRTARNLRSRSASAPSENQLRLRGRGPFLSPHITHTHAPLPLSLSLQLSSQTLTLDPWKLTEQSRVRCGTGGGPRRPLTLIHTISARSPLSQLERQQIRVLRGFLLPRCPQFVEICLIEERNCGKPEGPEAQKASN